MEWALHWVEGCRLSNLWKPIQLVAEVWRLCVFCGRSTLHHGSLTSHAVLTNLCCKWLLQGKVATAKHETRQLCWVCLCAALSEVENDTHWFALQHQAAVMQQAIQCRSSASS